MRMDPAEIRRQLQQRAEKDRRDAQVLQRTREYLESSVGDQERGLREMLQQMQLVVK